MTEFASTQGKNPVTAPQPENGVLTARVPVRKPISADSFRKLTAFLKKDAVPLPVAPALEVVEPAPPEIPDTIVPVIFAPAVIEPALPEITEIPKTVDIVVPVTLAPAVVPENIVASMMEHAIVPEFIAPETIVPEFIVPEITVDSLPLSVSEPEPVAVAAFTIEPEMLLPLMDVVPEALIVAVEPPQPATPSAKQRPRDAFALPPSALPQSRPDTVVAPPQTAAQEQEAAELARSLLDMMASGASSGLPQERALAADTLLRMLPRLPLKSLIVLADRLCIMDAPPHLLVAKLICDPRIEVAGPLLEECSHITDEDLSLVIQEGEPAKRRMMARRRRVSRAITAQLVSTEDPSVLLNLVRNQNAEISHESFEQLVRHASGQHDLLAPLCIRADLPVPFAFELFWAAPAQLRRYLLSRFLTDSETLTKILKIALVSSGDENFKVEFPDPEKIKDALQMADDGKLDEAASLLGECAKINPGTAARILADRQGDSLAALFKAIGIPRSTVSEILQGLMTSASGMIDPSRDPEELKSLFDSLSFNKARILLTYWDWAILKTGPYAPLN